MNNPFEPINARLNNLEALTLEVLQHLRCTTPPPPADDFLSVKEAAEFLNVAPQTIYQNVKRIKHSKRMGKLHFRRSDLVDFIENGRPTNKKQAEL